MVLRNVKLENLENQRKKFIKFIRFCMSVIMGLFQKGKQIEYINGIKDDNRLGNLIIKTKISNLKRQQEE